MSQIKQLVEDKINLLEILTFTGLYNDVIEFNVHRRDEIYERFKLFGMSDDILDRLSFLRTSDSSSEDKDRSYHFLHLTFQEFLRPSILYVALNPTDHSPVLNSALQSKRALHMLHRKGSFSKKYSERYNIFWCFVAGLLHDQGEKQPLRFFDTLGDKPRDLMGPVHQRLLMHCLSEVPPSDSKPGLEHLRVEVETQLKQWALFECKRRGRTQLCCEMEFPDHLLDTMLEEESVDVKEIILEALKDRSQLSPHLLDQVGSFLGHDAPEDLALSAINALCGQPSLPYSILQVLVWRLEDADFHVRNSATSILVMQSSLPDSILQALVLQLENANLSIRIFAINALDRQSLSDSILQALVSQLEEDAYSSSQVESILRKRDGFYSSRLGPASFPVFIQNMDRTQLCRAVEYCHARWEVLH